MSRPLRSGWTTGACAAAAAAAAFQALARGTFPDPVSIALPRGRRPSFPLSRRESGERSATAGVIKDAGDDPDVTDGAEVVTTVEAASPGAGLVFRAGEGVGTVTRPGLRLAPGEPAINPGPRRIIAAALREVADSLGVSVPDLVVTVSIPGGEGMAAKTLNRRLGIVGGLSVLGTTGVVTPYSHAAWIQSIHAAAGVAAAAGRAHLAGATGSASEAAVRALHDLPDEAVIEMGGFVGAFLKAARRAKANRLTVACGFAKACKLAAGRLDLHSSRGRVDRDRLAEWADDRRVAGLPTAAAALVHAPALGPRVAVEALAVVRAHLPPAIVADVAVVDAAGRLVGWAR